MNIPPEVKRKHNTAIRILIGMVIGALLGWLGSVW